MRTLPLYFDFISPYAYFAHLQVARLQSTHDVQVAYRPVLFAALLDHHGQLGPAEIPSKREATFRDISRYATRHGIPLHGPATHPFVPTTALRLALPEVSGEHQVTVIDTIFGAGWGRGIDLGSPRALADALSEAGLPGEAWVARTREPDVKAALRRNTEEAIALGVFGVPTFDVGGELVWGNDRVAVVEEILQGADPLPAELYERLRTLPAGASRPKSTKP